MCVSRPEMVWRDFPLREWACTGHRGFAAEPHGCSANRNPCGRCASPPTNRLLGCDAAVRFSCKATQLPACPALQFHQDGGVVTLSCSQVAMPYATSRFCPHCGGGGGRSSRSIWTPWTAKPPMSRNSSVCCSVESCYRGVLLSMVSTATKDGALGSSAAWRRSDKLMAYFLPGPPQWFHG